MAFIDFTPTTPTKDETLTRDIALTKNQGRQLLTQLKNYAQTTLQTVWANDSYSAQDYFTKIGTDGGSAIQQHGQLIAFLATQGITIDTSMVKATSVDSSTGVVTVTA